VTVSSGKVACSSFLTKRVTDRLIPLYAVGAFLAFTLSQAGMVVHWQKARGPGAVKSMCLNGLGACATAITVAVVLVAKFTEGAWITVILIPAMMLMMRGIKAHYDRVERETASDVPVNTQDLSPPIVVIPIGRWSAVSSKALRFAWTLSPDVRLVHVESGEATNTLRQRYAELVAVPAREAGLPVPELVVLASPYRFVVRPILEYALHLEKSHPDGQIAVLIPAFVESRWYYFLLHNNRSQVLRALLLFSGEQRITVINIPWYLKE
jgi:hypothetical protein